VRQIIGADDLGASRAAAGAKPTACYRLELGVVSRAAVWAPRSLRRSRPFEACSHGTSTRVLLEHARPPFSECVRMAVCKRRIRRAVLIFARARNSNDPQPAMIRSDADPLGRNKQAWSFLDLVEEMAPDRPGLPFSRPHRVRVVNVATCARGQRPDSIDVFAQTRGRRSPIARALPQR